MEAAATFSRISTTSTAGYGFTRAKINNQGKFTLSPLSAATAPTPSNKSGLALGFGLGVPRLSCRCPQWSFSGKAPAREDDSRFNCRAGLTVDAPMGEDPRLEKIINHKDNKTLMEQEQEQEPPQQEEELSRATLLWRAAKIPLYTVALIPVTVGCAAAYYESGVFSLGKYLGILSLFVTINGWIKLSNDVYDFDTGADKDKKESVVNLFGNRDAINFIAWSLLALGFAGLSWMAIGARSLKAILYLAAANFGFYLYQCPPFRLSYYGVGEPLLFLSFGPFSTIGFYLLNSIKRELPITGTVVMSSILVGLTTALILFCSHFHQIKGDSAVGKMSPLVRLGTEMGSHVVKWSVLGLYMFLLTLGMANTIPFASVFLCALTVPVGVSLVNFVDKNHRDNAKIFMGKYFVVRLHTIFGMALSAGLMAARALAKRVPLQAVAGL